MKAPRNWGAARERRGSLSKRETMAMAAVAFKNRYVLIPDKVYNLCSRGKENGEGPEFISMESVKRLKAGREGGLKERIFGHEMGLDAESCSKLYSRAVHAFYEMGYIVDLAALGEWDYVISAVFQYPDPEISARAATMMLSWQGGKFTMLLDAAKEYGLHLKDYGQGRFLGPEDCRRACERFGKALYDIGHVESLAMLGEIELLIGAAFGHSREGVAVAAAELILHKWEHDQEWVNAMEYLEKNALFGKVQEIAALRNLPRPRDWKARGSPGQDEFKL